jgi:ABC-2 type transport system ATP-binding protein
MTVEARGVSKWFGQKVALSEVTVTFEPGVTGLLGPNGAGKTTLLRVLTGLQVPSQGEVSVLGVDPRADRSVYARVAMVPEDEAIYPDLTARRFVELKATLAGVDNPTAATKEAIATVDLADAADRRMGGFSKGMRQRAKVASALVSNPAVLVLDEPLNGADPVQRAQLIELFIRLGAEGRTVIVSSHVLAEVERMTHRVVAMVDGRLAATGDLAALRAAMTDKPRQVFVRASEPRLLAAALMEIEGVDGITLLDGAMDVTTTDPVAFARALPTVARSRSITVSEVAPVDESLESVFRYLVEAGR